MKEFLLFLIAIALSLMLLVMDEQNEILKAAHNVCHFEDGSFGICYPDQQ